MTTWDDKPNDYEQACAIIERLRVENNTLREALENINRIYLRLWVDTKSQ